VAPMQFRVLADAMVTDPALRQIIAELLTIKRTAQESEYGQPSPVINAFIAEELMRLESTSPPGTGGTDFSVLDRLLMETVLRLDAPGTRTLSP